MAPIDGVYWNILTDVAWSHILQEIFWRDIGNARAVCRCWRRDVDRSLQRLHLRDPTRDRLLRLGNTFTRLAAVKVTSVRRDDVVHLDELSELPGALGRAGSLQLRSKQPGGGVLPVGGLRLLHSAGSVLSVLCLRCCEVTSWTGLESCMQLTQLSLVHCRFSDAAARGLPRTLAALTRLVHLEVRCTAARAPRRTAENQAAPLLHNHLHLNHNHEQHHQHAYNPNQQPHLYQQHQHYYHIQQHHVLQLSGLGAACPNLSVLLLAGPLPEEAVQELLREELPAICQLRELELDLRPAAAPAVDMVAQLAAAANGPSNITTAGLSYRELGSLLPAICSAAPRLTALRIRGHARLHDRDLMLLQPLRDLRRLALDLDMPQSEPSAAAIPPPPQQQQQQPGAIPPQGAHGAAVPIHLHSSTMLTGVGVMALLRAAPGLKAVSLAHSSWSAEGLRALGGCSGLSQLRLAGVLAPKGYTMCNFLYVMRNNLRHLVELDLSGCSDLTDWGLALIGRCCGAGGAESGSGRGGAGSGAVGLHLRALLLGGCGELAGDVGVAALAPLMSHLQRLDLSFMERLTDQGVLGLLRSGAPNLQHLALDHCPLLGDTGVQSVAAGCPALQHLSLDHCPRLTATVAAAVRLLQGLRRLSAEGCGAALTAALQDLPAARPLRSVTAARWWLAPVAASATAGAPAGDLP